MGVAWGKGAKLINNKKCHMRTVRQPVMAGLGGPEGPGTPYTQAKPRQQRVETPFPVPPPHWEAPSLLASE